MAQLVSALLLTLMALREALWSLGEQPDSPATVEILSFVAIGVGLWLRFRAVDGPRRRMVTLLALGTAVYAAFIRGPELYWGVASPFVQSYRSALLSRIDYGLPWLGVLALLVHFLLSAALYEFLSFEAPPSAAGPWRGGRGPRVLRVVVSALFFAFGLLALFSYGSGSPWPFLT